MVDYTIKVEKGKKISLANKECTKGSNLTFLKAVLHPLHPNEKTDRNVPVTPCQWMSNQFNLK